MSALRSPTGSVLLTALAVALVLVSVGRGDTPSEVRLATGRYQQDLVRWEVTHFLDKWLHLAAVGLFRRSPSEEERRGAVDEFFALGGRLRGLTEELQQVLASPANADLRAPEAVARDSDVLRERRDELRPSVEEALEVGISDAVDELGIIRHVGPVRWPPVDFTFEQNPLVLVRSPRDEIRRLGDVLLEPGVSLLEQVGLEADIERRSGEVSALVLRVGGVATYPAQVRPSASLHATLVLASHEWLHHWLFFRPLGRAWFAGGELMSINETVANIASEEIGDLALRRLTGEVFERAPWRPRERRPGPPPDVFDFSREMRATRIRLQELLGGGLVEEAGVYLEERRLEFVANGHNIRKLNNAWFAFHGTYADSAASLSPIEAQLRAIRADEADLSGFLDRVSVIAEQGMLEAVAREAGWEAPE